ncbi:hypothetical protein B0J15DRAFT_562961, partial [Fusarium solani]
MVFGNISPDKAEVTEQNETTPWLQHTRWPELFHNRPLDIIAASARQPGPIRGEDYLLGQWKGTSFWSSADAEAQLRILLRGVDLMFDRATATLARTSYTSRCWLNTYSKDVFWPHAFRLVSCFKRYVSVWKRFICFIFRVLRFKARHRQQIYNLRLGSDEEKMMQYILTLVAQLLLEGGGCDLDPDDDDDSETDEDADYEEEEHVEEENYPMGDESD